MKFCKPSVANLPNISNSFSFLQTFGIPLSQYEALVNSVDQNDSLQIGGVGVALGSLETGDTATAGSLEAGTVVTADSLEATTAGSLEAGETVTARELKFLDAASLSAGGLVDLASSKKAENVAGGRKIGALKSEPFSTSTESETVSTPALKVIFKLQYSIR